jgi:putative membrane protein
MWWGDYWPMPFPFIGIVFMIICMAMMFFMMRGMHRRGSDALEILRERFARGEIDQAEYEERRRLLRA